MKFVASVILLSLWLGARGAAAQESAHVDFKDARTQCEDHVKELRNQAHSLQLIAMIVAAVGGLGAAVTGLKAGGSTGKKGKAWGWVAFVSGVAAAFAPQIPKAKPIEQKLALADSHWIKGLKVERQIAMLGNDDQDSRVFGQKCARYVVARYTDCLGDDAKPPPELPVYDDPEAKRRPLPLEMKVAENPSAPLTAPSKPDPAVDDESISADLKKALDRARRLESLQVQDAPTPERRAPRRR